MRLMVLKARQGDGCLWQQRKRGHLGQHELRRWCQKKSCNIIAQAMQVHRVPTSISSGRHVLACTRPSVPPGGLRMALMEVQPSRVARAEVKGL